MKIIVVTAWHLLPDGASEDGSPVVRGISVLTFPEEEILPIRALRIPKSLLKPLMLIRTMIDNHIQNEPDTQLLPGLNHPVKILHRAEHRIDLIVIRYIISVIHHR